MTKNLSKTLHYYNQSAQTFVQGTIDADLGKLHRRFLKLLPIQAHILDLGCGSGRDAKAFLGAGYQVTAMDGLAGCCRLAEDYIGQEVLCQRPLTNWIATRPLTVSGLVPPCSMCPMPN